MKSISYLLFSISEIQTTPDFIFYIFELTQQIKKKVLKKLDDYGLERLSEYAVIRFYDILDCLYGNGSIIITTQLRHNSLKTAIPEKCTIREALMDRLQRPGDRVITLNGKSWRGSTGEFKGDK